MIIKKFKLKAKDTDFWFWIYIYDEIRALQKASNRFDEARGLKFKHHVGVVGICHPYTRQIIKPGQEDRMHENIGIIRLSKKYLTTEVISHELIHAAFWQYRLMYGSEREYEGSSENADFGNVCSELEEDFAYLYASLFRKITIKLYKYKFWV